MNFNNSLPFLGGGETIVDLVALKGNNLTAPIVTTNVGKTTGTAATATANLPVAPNAGDVGLVFLAAQQDLGTSAPTAAPAMSSTFYSHTSSGTAGIYTKVPPTQNESFAVGTGRNWGAIALEIAHS